MDAFGTALLPNTLSQLHLSGHNEMTTETVSHVLIVNKHVTQCVIRSCHNVKQIEVRQSEKERGATPVSMKI